MARLTNYEPQRVKSFVYAGMGTISNQTGAISTRTEQRQFGVRIGRVTGRFLLVALLGLASLFYLHQAASGAGQTKALSALNAQLDSLQRQTRELETEKASAQSLQNIEASRDKFNLQPVTRPDLVVGVSGGFLANR